MYLFTDVACNHEMQPFFNGLFVVGGGDFGSGSGCKFNCAAQVGSGQTISGTQTSTHSLRQ